MFFAGFCFVDCLFSKYGTFAVLIYCTVKRNLGVFENNLLNLDLFISDLSACFCITLTCLFLVCSILL